MQDAGVISISLDLADGFVCSAAIRSSRPAGLARLFEGRAPQEAPLLARRLFTLCSRAQGAAANAAIEAALGTRVDPETRRLESIGVLAERLFETLRACILAWPGAASFARRAGAPLRAAAAAAQALAQGRETLDAFARLAAAAEAIGVPRADDGEPAPDTPFALILRQCAGEDGLLPAAGDALTVRDDEAVAMALEADPAGFAIAPELDGRRPETGAFARVFADLPLDESLLTTRARARLIDARRALADLDKLISRKDEEAEQVIVAARTASGAGFGVVECARGRLYHMARVGANGRIEVYGLVAPTEWNFHPNGPLAMQLVGARLGRAEAARAVVQKLATLVDPCVAFEVSAKESA